MHRPPPPSSAPGGEWRLMLDYQASMMRGPAAVDPAATTRDNASQQKRTIRRPDRRRAQEPTALRAGEQLPWYATSRVASAEAKQASRLSTTAQASPAVHVPYQPLSDHSPQEHRRCPGKLGSHGEARRFDQTRSISPGTCETACTTRYIAKRCLGVTAALKVMGPRSPEATADALPRIASPRPGLPRPAS